jgi:integrase/recombinase XerC/integrase/recombinase XerD
MLTAPTSLDIAKAQLQAAMADLREAFLSSLDVADSSRAFYGRATTQYLAWLEQTGRSLENITAADILRYKEDLLSRQPQAKAPGKASALPQQNRLSSLTVSSYLAAVRRFYSWAESMKLYQDVAKGIRSPKREQKFRRQPLTPGQARDLLAYYQARDPRDYAIVSLLLRAGLRTVELTRADIQDLKLLGGQRVLLIQGKGHTDKDSFVVLTEKAYQPIMAYLETRKDTRLSDPLFISESNNSKGQRLTTRKISQVAKDGLRAIGLDERAFTAHSLRHTTAVSILRAGGSLEDAQLTLRHRSPATTQIYTHTLNEQRRLERSGESLIDSLY